MLILSIYKALKHPAESAGPKTAPPPDLPGGHAIYPEYRPCYWRLPV